MFRRRRPGTTQSGAALTPIAIIKILDSHFYLDADVIDQANNVIHFDMIRNGGLEWLLDLARNLVQ